MDATQGLIVPAPAAGVASRPTHCPDCRAPWQVTEPRSATALGGAEILRCQACGERRLGPDFTVRLGDCQRCGSAACGLGDGGDCEAAGSEPEIVRASEAEALRGIARSWSFLRAEATAVYLDRVCRDAATAIAGAPTRARVVLVDDARWFALGLPSGTVLLSLGVLSSLSDEAELVFVLGRELSHIAAGTAGTSLVHAGLRAVAAARRGAGDAWVHAVEGLLRLGHGDGNERRADRQALEGLLALGYDPDSVRRSLGDLGRRIARGEREVGDVALALPPAGARASAIERRLKERADRPAGTRVNRALFRRAAGQSVLAFDLRPATLGEPSAAVAGRRAFPALRLALLVAVALSFVAALFAYLRS